MLRLGGIPLIARSIQQAKLARSVARVVVSTDDAEIAEVSKEHGAQVVWRPDEISGDAAASESALLHVLDHLETTEGYKPDMLTFLQCTAPLMLAEDIDGLVKKLVVEKADSGLTVCRFKGFLWRTENSGNAVAINHNRDQRLRRQELEPQYLESGAVYVMAAQPFRARKHRFFGKVALYEIPSWRCREVDDPTDLPLVEALLREQAKELKMRRLPPKPLQAVILDFDGVLTDNRVTVSQDGRESVVCNRSDGLGLSMLQEMGIPVAVVSREENAVVAKRCQKLKLPCFQGVRNKAEVIRGWLQERGLSRAQVIYVGNDLNDLEAMALVGCPVAVADARSEVKRAAQLVLETPGGHGAIQELADLIRASTRNGECDE